MIWFTADLHFGHKNIINLCNRPFKDLKDMHSQLINNWNNCVSSSDVVYVLGDMAFTYRKEEVTELLYQLNGTMFLITGNHETKAVMNSKRWAKVTPYHEIKVDRGGEHKQRICMFHYAQRVWNQMNRGAWQLHGHSHGQLPSDTGKTVDVGVDVWDYAPVSIDTLGAYMARRSNPGDGWEHLDTPPVID
jgi:calcineurin-like phosphoesterase family protein